MKKFLLLFAVVAFVGSTATAQCTKSKKACTKAKTTSVSTANELPACSTKAAAMLASQDENIEAKTCSKSGTVSYYKKNVCERSGKVSLNEVKFCSTAKGFVNVAPSTDAKAVNVSDTSAKKKACAKSCAKSKKACSSKSK